MEVKQTRHQEIKLIKYDDPFSNIRYTGRSSSLRGLDSEPIWQIMREYKNCATGVTVETHANMGEFNCVWNDRTTYFTAAVGDSTCSISSSVSISGGVKTQGLTLGGLVTEVVLNDTTWTALPAPPLPSRNAVSIQNFSGQLIKLNYNPATVGLVGVNVMDQNERFYDISDTILIYGKSTSGTCTIVVEEIA